MAEIVTSVYLGYAWFHMWTVMSHLPSPRHCSAILKVTDLPAFHAFSVNPWCLFVCFLKLVIIPGHKNDCCIKFQQCSLSFENCTRGLCSH